MKSTIVSLLNLSCYSRLALQNTDDQCDPTASGGRQAPPSQGKMVEENERRRTVRGEGDANLAIPS